MIKVNKIDCHAMKDKLMKMFTSTSLNKEDCVEGEKNRRIWCVLSIKFLQKLKLHNWGVI